VHCVQGIRAALSIKGTSTAAAAWKLLVVLLWVRSKCNVTTTHLGHSAWSVYLCVPIQCQQRHTKYSRIQAPTCCNSTASLANYCSNWWLQLQQLLVGVA
jgi:hypothetical protein